MSRNTPEHIIAHVDLLRSVDILLEQAEVVRQKREILERLIAGDIEIEKQSLRQSRYRVSKVLS